jgi:hypothetical protein
MEKLAPRGSLPFITGFKNKGRFISVRKAVKQQAGDALVELCRDFGVNKPRGARVQDDQIVAGEPPVSDGLQRLRDELCALDDSASADCRSHPQPTFITSGKDG